MVKRYNLPSNLQRKLITQIFEDSQNSQILFTNKEVSKTLQNFEGQQNHLSCHLIDTKFLYFGMIDSKCNLEGLGILIDFDGQIKMGNFHQNELMGFGLKINKKLIFAGRYYSGQLNGEVYVANLNSGEYKLCFYENSKLNEILEEGKTDELKNLLHFQANESQDYSITSDMKI